MAFNGSVVMTGHVYALAHLDLVNMQSYLLEGALTADYQQASICNEHIFHYDSQVCTSEIVDLFLCVLWRGKGQRLDDMAGFSHTL
jgi:hypothetical protein